MNFTKINHTTIYAFFNKNVVKKMHLLKLRVIKINLRIVREIPTVRCLKTT